MLGILLAECVKAYSCHICNKKYIDKDIVLIDHCHITGSTPSL